MNRFFLTAAIVLIGFSLPIPAQPNDGPRILEMENLVAWCVVPFDAAQRGPIQRARMLKSLGFTKLAYDWRAKDIPTFDTEVEALKDHGIQLHAFWCPVESLEPLEEKNIKIILDLLERHKIKTQLWVSLGRSVLDGVKESNRVKAVAEAVGVLARKAKTTGSSIGLYNHGGWFGDPRNQIAIIRWLGLSNVGIVYNFHHGHQEIDQFPALLTEMKPYLLTLNLNGMRAGGPKILTLGDGDQELAMLREVLASGYSGPIGILDHQPERDTRAVLEENLRGLRELSRQLRD
jgi:sugar phosphate isomerase/epimerase